MSGEKKDNAVSTRVANLTETMASKYSMSSDNFLKTFKASVFKSLKREPTMEEVAMIMLIAKEYDLNPFVNQIYAFPSSNGAILPIVGIDGFCTIAERNKDYDGIDIVYADKEITLEGGKVCPEWCEVKVYRKNLTHPIVVREYLDEVYVAPRGANKYAGPWQSHTKRMLRHKALIQAFRLAFAITGIYDEDEAKRVEEATIIDVTGKPDVEMPKAIEAKSEAVKEEPTKDAKPEPTAEVPAEKPVEPPKREETTFPSPKTKEEYQEIIPTILMMMSGQDIAKAKSLLKEITAWQTDAGKVVAGKDSVLDLTEKQLPVIYGKVKKAYLEWEKKNEVQTNG